MVVIKVEAEVVSLGQGEGLLPAGPVLLGAAEVEGVLCPRQHPAVPACDLASAAAVDPKAMQLPSFVAEPRSL